MPKLNNNNNCDFDQLTVFIAPPARIQHKTSEKFTCVFETNAFVNDIKVNKTFYQNKTWSLNINCNEVNLTEIEIDDKLMFSKESIEQVCLIVQKLHLCIGIIMKKACVVEPTQSLHNWKDGQNYGHSLRSNCCLHVVNFGSTNDVHVCRACQTMTKPSRKTDNKNHNIKDEASNVQSEKEKCIRQILNNAEPELVQMILQQSKNMTRKPNGHRWSKEFVGTCLQIFNKSPNARRVSSHTHLRMCVYSFRKK